MNLRSIEKIKGEKLVNNINAIDHIEVSAKYGRNVELAFQKFVNHVILDVQEYLICYKQLRE